MDRVKEAEDAALKDYVAEIGRAVAGMTGDPDVVCEFFTDKYNRHVAQAVLQLIEHTQTIREVTRQKTRSQLRKESGFAG